MQKKENRGQPMVLTSGSIKKQLVLFSIPIFSGTLLQQLYNVIDAVVAGRLVYIFDGFKISYGVWRGNFSKVIVTDYSDPCRAFRACFGIFENGIFGYSVFNAV